MYHYVRDLTNSRYPGIKGLDIEKFKNQINYIKSKYNVIKMEDFVDSLKIKSKLPSNSALLTFDDGYIDHFTNVLPVLVDNQLQGSFFVPAGIVNQNVVLDVNKIHFTLESCDNVSDLISEIFVLLDKYKSKFSLESKEYYYNKLAVSNRFDSPDIIFVKRILQSELHLDLRKIIIDHLYCEFVNVNENVLSRELYLNLDQIKLMLKLGMHIGAHGYNHFWFEKLDKSHQEFEVKKSINFLHEIGVNLDYMTMCYPYGSYNNITLDLLGKYNFQCAFNTIPTVANLETLKKFEIPRLDTNDLLVL